MPVWGKQSCVKLVYTCCKHHFSTWVLAGKNYSLPLKIITIILAIRITSEYFQCIFLEVLHHQQIIATSCPASLCRKKKYLTVIPDRKNFLKWKMVKIPSSSPIVFVTWSYFSVHDYSFRKRWLEFIVIPLLECLTGKTQSGLMVSPDI